MNKVMRLCAYLCILICFFGSIEVHSQSLLPFSLNFSKSDYHGDNQIWSISQGSDYAIYFANNQYFIRYNGVFWEKYQLPQKTIIRSVFALKDTIFTGSYNEFGYWLRRKGKMEYTSLVPAGFFKDEKSSNEEVWKIFRFRGNLYFQSFNQLYVYDGKLITKIQFPAQMSYCFEVGSELWAASIFEGIFAYRNGSFVKIVEPHQFHKSIVHSVLHFKDFDLIFTQKEGVYIKNQAGLLAWNHPINEALKKYVVNVSLKISNEMLAIGTASNGLYLVNMKNGSSIHINRSSRLINNTVLSLTLDYAQNLWVGTDNGISYIELSSPYRFFSDQSGKLGSVYSLLKYNNSLLLGSNHGMFELSGKTLKFIEGTAGQVWNLSATPSGVVVGHNDGTMLYNGSISMLSSLNGGWSFKPNQFGKGYFQSHYTGIAWYDFEKGTEIKPLNLPPMPIRNFYQISPKIILAANNNRSFFKVELDASNQIKSYVNLSQKSGIQNDFGVKIFDFHNQKLVLINGQWYYYDFIKDQLLPYDLFNTYFKGVNEFIPIDNERFGFVKEGRLFLVLFRADKFIQQPIPLKYYFGRLIPGESKMWIYDSKIYLNLDDGFLVFDTNFINKNTKHNILCEAYDDQWNRIESEDVVPNRSNISLVVVDKFLNVTSLEMFYSINGEPVQKIEEGLVALKNLSGGHYEIAFFISNRGALSLVDELEFDVKSVWLLSWWMFILYFIVVSTLAYGYYRWTKMRFKQKLKIKEEELWYKNQILQMEMETEHKIKLQEYENQLLKHQVSIKAGELAGKSLSLAKQTELIQSIHGILNKELEPEELKAKISAAIKSNRLGINEWKSFENNLLASNEPLVKILSTRYSNLTAKDLMLCIYLKMNLSSKEIAPLMKVTFRGVELQRYRLRKKFNLPSDANLNIFINSLS